MKKSCGENHLLADKEKLLATALTKPWNLAVAFSGGVDSSLLLAMAAKYRKSGTTYAITCATSLMSEKEITEATEICRKLGIEHIILTPDPLSIEEVKNNDPKRCYYCKKVLFGAMLEQIKTLGGGILAEASHADDVGIYRPGMAALQELDIWQPLIECNLTKSDIRTLAEMIGLKNSQKPAKPCYATRFPYYTKLTKTKIEQVKTAEEYIESLGFSPCRLRLHDDIARIEIAAKQHLLALEKREEIITKLKEIGFHYICLDLEGFRSGSMDK